MSELGAGSRAAELCARVVERTPAGEWVLDDRPARALLSLLALALARADASVELPRPLMEQIGAFAREADVRQVPASEQAIRLEEYLLAQLPPAFKLEVERFFREELALGDDGARKLAAALGIEKRAGPLDSGARPSGSTAAGPLARFQLQVPPPKRR